MAKSKNKHIVYNFDTIVIGSGPAGSTAAEILANSGQKVAIVEAAEFGGECLNYGCVPTKSMLTAAHLYSALKNQKAITNSSIVKLRISKLADFAKSNIAKTGAHQLAEELTKSGITTLKGRGYLINSGVVDVSGQSYSARNIILAGGGEVAVPNIPGIDGLDYLTYKNFLQKVKERAPKSITIIGGGAVGCEYAQILSSCGIKVNILEKAQRLIADQEPEASVALQNYFQKLGIKLYLEARIISAAASSTGNLKEVEVITSENEKVILKTDSIMLAAGKKMRDGDGLSNAGISCTEKGFISTNQFCQTETPNIYAIGDAAGPYRLTSTALLQAKIAAANILAKNKRSKLLSLDLSVVPTTIFTMPEIAKVGQSTTFLQQNNIAFKQVLVPLEDVSRSSLEEDYGGFAKLWINPSSRQLLGACLVGPAAAEQILSLAVVLQNGLTVDQLASTISVFPTWSEAINLAASEL